MCRTHDSIFGRNRSVCPDSRSRSPSTKLSFLFVDLFGYDSLDEALLCGRPPGRKRRSTDAKMQGEGGIAFATQFAGENLNVLDRQRVMNS